MAKPLNAYIKNAIAQLFDEIENKCHVKFATFTASDSQGEKNLAAGTREYMDDKENNKKHAIKLAIINLNFLFIYNSLLVWI